ncbi:enoyl-CoA hydratase/isomerase family protein [Rhodophyticola porphyridii]|uniref:Enoyl-CoA hydratase/isomerase family protein n=1 Tax=Rhodophyticola porphyridii TaxID=1852017 RepID=A0A3L9Y5U3_9RHOB|nr:enoyl-CoA hydratase/isomerase family protein [Rhodophyticola porphyridii]RMA42648.1 enoyl-CoA hydratase/isomerase family protein [Rhodophyticola porphyridii]
MIDLIREGGLWLVMLNRPDKANSLTEDMLRHLAEIAEDAGNDPSVRALVLTGAGDRVFSAGADLEAAKAGLATSPIWERLSGAIADLPCLSIAALNGTLAGGAFGMVLACDLRIAVPEARFFYPVAKLGFLPQPSDPARMAALIGLARTKLLLLAGQKLTAQEALDFGLIDRLVLRDGLLAMARDLAADALAGDAETLRGIKRLCR